MESSGWSLDPTLLKGNPLATEIPSGTSATTCGNPASPLAPPPHSLPVCGEAVSSVCPWLLGFSPASVQLVIHDDFSII